MTNYCTNISTETKFINTGNRKTNEPHKFVLSLPQRLDLYVPFQNLSICYTWKSIIQQHKNNKLKLLVPTWNDVFDSSYSVLDIQDYIEYIKRTKKIIN